MRALIFGLERWMGAGRLPRLLRHAGFEVGVLSSSDSFLAATRHVDRRFPLNPVDARSVLRDLGTALDDFEPMVLVPADQSVVSFLQSIVLAAEAGHPVEMSHAAQGIVSGSLPPSSSFPAVTRKEPFLRLCNLQGIRVPEWRRIDTVADALGFAEEYGYPAVVKTAATIGGMGVHVCDDEDALARAAFATLPQFTSHGGPTVDSEVTVERFIQGDISHIAAVCWKGEVLAHTAAIKLRLHPERTGPGSVFRFVDPALATGPLTAFVAHTRMTGFCGLDYIVDERDGRAVFLECNPRFVPQTSAAVHAGIDLGAALFAKLAGSPKPQFFLREGTTVAMYPQEMLRDPQSEFLKTAIVDVPQDDPELLAAYQAFVAEIESHPAAPKVAG